jgi:hypothetical protein
MYHVPPNKIIYEKIWLHIRDVHCMWYNINWNVSLNKLKLFDNNLSIAKKKSETPNNKYCIHKGLMAVK